MARLFEGVTAMTDEIERKLAEIRGCPEPCGDGTVKIGLSSGQIRKMPCPIIASGCPYGKRMELGLDKYISSVMSGIDVPLRHLENLAETRRTEATSEVAKWSTRGFLVFFGDTGSGKSFGAALAVQKYLKSQVMNRFEHTSWERAERVGNSVAWCSAMDIGDDREVAARAKRAFLTVIDDLGGEANIPVTQNVIHGVILKRYDMKQPTVITTTLTMLDIDARYGSRIADRPTEDIGTGGKIIDCGNISMRSPAALFTAGGR
jgi:hypothetical protein